MKLNYKRIWQSVPKRTAALGLVLAIVMTPLAISAWGAKRPTYTIEKPANYITFNSITNNPNYGDERNFLSVRDLDRKEWDKANKNGWTDTMTLKEGHTYEAKLYVHNNAAANLKLVATNVRAHLNLPVKESTFSRQFEVNAFLWSDNARPNEIWDNIVLKSDRDFHVKVVSQKYFNNARPEKTTSGFDLGSELTSATGRGTGALLGYDKMDGKIPGCFAYDGYVSIKFKPVYRVVPKPDFDVSKSVNKSTAAPSDVIKYTLSFKNTGNANLHDVVLNDALPKQLSVVKDSVKSTTQFTGNVVDGLKLSMVKPGEVVNITFDAKVKADTLKCGDNIVTNSVSASSKEVAKEDKSKLSNNTVSTKVVKACQPNVPETPTPKPIVPTPAKPTPTPTQSVTPNQPREIARTGADDAIGATVILTLLAALSTAYLRSRH